MFNYLVDPLAFHSADLPQLPVCELGVPCQKQGNFFSGIH